MMDIVQIKEIIPHRYPFLLVERIVECASDAIVGIKNVSVNEAFFQGHFPTDPIMPGVLILEAMAQTAGILVLYSYTDIRNKPFYFAGVDKVAFPQTRAPRRPARYEGETSETARRFFKMLGEAFVDDVAGGRSRNDGKRRYR